SGLASVRRVAQREASRRRLAPSGRYASQGRKGVNMLLRKLLLSGIAFGVVFAALACGGSSTKTVEKLFSPQNNELDIYDLKTGAKTVLIPNTVRNVDGQTCLLPGGDGRFLIAEDIYQDIGARQGWEIFSPDG